MTPDTGTFTITYTGMTAGVTGTARWSRAGNVILLLFPAATGTSNATTMTATGLPAAIQPTRTQNIGLSSGLIENNTGASWQAAGATITASSGTITFTLGGTTWAGGGFTASGTKGVPVAFLVTYMLN
jgi:hypothetical protein